MHASSKNKINTSDFATLLRRHKRLLIFVFLIVGYLITLKLKHPQVFSYRFDHNLINRYFLSQDITQEVPGKRLFLSDGEIHIAAGYLYVTGYNPIQFNFQHPPLIKYLYGLSILLWQNPYVVQVGLGLLLLLMTYIWSFRLTSKVAVATLACGLMIIDPLFLQLSSEALLDMGQSVLLIAYFLALIYHPQKSFLTGITLGLLFMAKFWGGVGFLVAILILYQFSRKKILIKDLILQSIVALVVVFLVYLPVFWQNHGNFNLIFFQLKTIKYWFNHSTASVFGSSLILFLSGYFKSWWGQGEVIRSDTWSIFWPIGTATGLIWSIKNLIKKQVTPQTLNFGLPLLYLLFLGFQAPFVRYFILILPFIYTTTSTMILLQLNRFKLRK